VLWIQEILPACLYLRLLRRWLSYGALKLHPFWDLLRGYPRFEKIVASLAPKLKRQPCRLRASTSAGDTPAATKKILASPALK